MFSRFVESPRNGSARWNDGNGLTREVAQKLVNLRLDATAQAHIDRLAQKCNDGELTEAERREYETCVYAIDFISILQAKARAFLRRSTGDQHQ